MGKILRTLLIMVALPLEMALAVVREIFSAGRMLAGIWRGDTYFAAVTKEFEQRIEWLKAEREKAERIAAELAEKLGLRK